MRSEAGGNDNGAEGDEGDDDFAPEAGTERAAFVDDADGDDTRVIEISEPDGDDTAGDDDSGEDVGGDAQPRESREGGEGEARRRGRRRGRRGGRRNRERMEGPAAPGLDSQPILIDDDAPAHGREPVGGRTERQSFAPSRSGHAGEPGEAVETGSEEAASPARPSRHAAAERAETHGHLGAHETAAPVGHPEPAPSEPPASTSRTENGNGVPRHRQRALTEPGEPKIERVVVRSDAEGEAAPPVEGERPARKGWWSRRFGGE